MAKATPWDKWAFTAAWVIASILALGGLAGQAWVGATWWGLVFVILGLVVGFMYSAKDITPLVLMTLALILLNSGASLLAIPYLGGLVDSAVGYFMAFLSPAALVLVLKKVYALLK